MSDLKFSISELKKALAKSKHDAKVTFAGDHGVYLCFESVRIGTVNEVVYAKDCNPDKDEYFYENKRHLVGGDDFGVQFDITVKELFDILQDTRKRVLTVKMRGDDIEVIL